MPPDPPPPAPFAAARIGAARLVRRPHATTDRPPRAARVLSRVFGGRASVGARIRARAGRHAARGS